MRRSVMVFLSGVLLVLAMSRSIEARTWYVNEAGTGDAPTIRAAMDSAAYGDTVLVGPGRYPGGIIMSDGVTLRSEMGPTATILDGGHCIVYFGTDVSGSLEGFTLTGDTDNDIETVLCWEACDFLIKGNIFTGNKGGGIGCDFSRFGQIVANTIVDNQWTGIYVRQMSDDISVRNNICVGNSDGISVGESPNVDVECNDSWGNTYSDFYPQDPWDPPWPWGSNISEDPLFCDREAGDFTLNSCSPCLPGNHPGGFDCGLIGALGQGCYSPSAVQQDTWSTIKSLFR